jgi:Domain of unknown function (DUF4178)
VPELWRHHHLPLGAGGADHVYVLQVDPRAHGPRLESCGRGGRAAGEQFADSAWYNWRVGCSWVHGRRSDSLSLGPRPVDDGSSAWLSDAQLQYSISALHTEAVELPDASAIRRSDGYRFGSARFVVTTVTDASFDGVEGELPFEYWDKTTCTFVDLAGERGAFATIDYSESPPLIFVGESIDFRSLELQHLVTFDGWPMPAAR